jgi:hypothetical protein
MPGVSDPSEVQRRVSRPGTLDRLRRDPGFRRRVMLYGFGASVGTITLVTVIFAVLIVSSSGNYADRLAAVGDVLVGATLLLVVVAAVVGLLAYAVSTGMPDLEMSVQFPFSIPNNPLFDADIQQDILERETYNTFKAKNHKQVFATILLRNRSGYSAKNPAVIVRLNGMAFSSSEPGPGWVVTDFASTMGVTAVQWDGGPAYSIHGNSIRRLPDLHMENLQTSPMFGGPPFLLIQILADGYRRDIKLEVEFSVESQTQFLQKDRALRPRWV